MTCRVLTFKTLRRKLIIADFIFLLTNYNDNDIPFNEIL